jgi:hypothetical protein
LATYYNTTTKIASIYIVAEALSTMSIKVQVFNANVYTTPNWILSTAVNTTLVGSLVHTVGDNSTYYKNLSTKTIAQINLNSTSLTNSGTTTTGIINSTSGTIATLNTTNITNALALSTYTTTTGSITSGLYQLSGVHIIDNSRNGILNNVRSDGVYMQGGGIKFQSGNGGGGVNTSSTLGWQAFPVSFAGYPNVICTMNSSSLTNNFVIQVCNVGTTGFNYYKRYQNVSGGAWGAAVGESFEWQATVN